MFSPHGPHSPTVYWRRRLVLLAGVAVLVALIALTLRVVLGDGSATATATSTSPTAAPLTSPQTTKYSPPPSSVHNRSTQPPAVPAGGSATGAAEPPSARTCDTAQLAVVAVTNRESYAVGAQPVLTMQVTNTGSVPCVQDLADRQVLLRVYNGESRVWGSHDCKTLPGTDNRVLSPRAAIRISIVWSGYSSRAHCAGNRLRVGIGTYTLYASLSGKVGEAAQFSIS